MPSPFPPQLIQALRNARSVTVLTGAGISSESGVPTFRDPQAGLWSRFRPEDLANAAAFRRNPQLVWDWYAWRRSLVADVAPNVGHLALAKLEARVPEFTLLTQNVDGLHSRAGSRNVIELHGSLMRNRCLDENVVVEPAAGDEGRPPKCPRCGGLLRPDVVWFGDPLAPAALTAAQEAAVRCQLFFSVGTSSMVNPAAQLPMLALQGGATVIEINPEPTRISDAVHLSVRGAAGAVLSGLVMVAWPDAV